MNDQYKNCVLGNFFRAFVRKKKYRIQHSKVDGRREIGECREGGDGLRGWLDDLDQRQLTSK